MGIATKSAKAVLDELTAEMAEPRIAASAVAAVRRDDEQRKLLLIHQGSFHGYACSVCGNRFLETSAPDGMSLFQMLGFYSEQREKQFTAHVCREVYKNPTGF
jgi:hypothetical protein